MKLSEAIRLGAMLRPQAYGNLQVYRRRWYGLFGAWEPKATCALGAAFEAAKCPSRPRRDNETSVPFRGEQSSTEHVEIVEYEWPVMAVAVQCPQCGETAPLFSIIPHLNDEHRWLREHIARLVEQVEDILTTREHSQDQQLHSRVTA